MKKDKIKIFLIFRKIVNILDENELSIKDKLLVVDLLNQHLLFEKSMNKKRKNEKE